jgi:hypothetical protein
VAKDARWTGQSLIGPRIPIVRTTRQAPGLSIVEEAFAVTQPLAGDDAAGAPAVPPRKAPLPDTPSRNDCILVAVTNTGSAAHMVTPRLLIDCRLPVTVDLDRQRATVDEHEQIVSSRKMIKVEQEGADKRIVHARFQSAGGLPPLRADLNAEKQRDWHNDLDRSGGSAFDWGVHAVDYTRFMTGLDLEAAQAFYFHPREYTKPLACTFNFRFTTGATMIMNFLAGGSTLPDDEAPFTFFYEGGRLGLYMYDRLEVDGRTVYRAEDFDPWFEQDRIFIEAVKSGDASLILNDYHDGLSSLAPVLAGWESARRGGETIDVASFSAA